MAAFVADGYLRFDGLVPSEGCERAVAEFENGTAANVWPDYEGQPPHLLPGRPLTNFFHGTAIGDMLALDEVRGVITSLVGPDPIYDHHYFHVTQPGSWTQPLHYDAIIDFRLDFD